MRPPPGQKHLELETFLRDQRAATDAAVPTMYDLTQQQNDDAKLRRQTTLLLWRLAESLKKRLSVKGTKDVTQDHSDHDISEFSLLTDVADRVGLPDDLEVTDLAELLKVSRQEVDALIDPEIDQTIGYANYLIEDAMRRMEKQSDRAGLLEVPEVDREAVHLVAAHGG